MLLFLIQDQRKNTNFFKKDNVGEKIRFIQIVILAILWELMEWF